MDLVINERNLGCCAGYHQNRAAHQWIFDMEAGFSVTVSWFDLKMFHSSGTLEITTKTH